MKKIEIREKGRFVPPNPVAKALRDPAFRPKKEKSFKEYSRKTKHKDQQS